RLLFGGIGVLVLVLVLVLPFRDNNQTTAIVAKLRVEKWETWVWFSTFPSGAKPGCGNVEISGLLRDFQETVERVEKLLSLFHSFHRHVISTAPACALQNV